MHEQPLWLESNGVSGTSLKRRKQPGLVGCDSLSSKLLLASLGIRLPNLLGYGFPNETH